MTNYLDPNTPLNETPLKGEITKDVSKKNIPTPAVNTLFSTTCSVDASA